LFRKVFRKQDFVTLKMWTVVMRLIIN